MPRLHARRDPAHLACERPVERSDEHPRDEDVEEEGQEEVRHAEDDGIPEGDAEPDGAEHSLLLEDEPDAAHRVNEPRGEPLVDRLPQVRDVDVDDVRAGVEAVAPDLLGDRAAGEDAVFVPEEVLEEEKFLGGEMDLLAAAAHAPRLDVELEVGDL